MKWTSFSILAAFLITSNVVVHANLDSSSLRQFTNPPSEVNDVLGRIQPTQLPFLTEVGQQEVVRRLGGLQDKARREAMDLNPLANGQIPSSLPSGIPGSSSVPSPTPSSGTSVATSTPTGASSRPQLGTIDPLGAGITALTTQATIDQQSDIATLTTGNAREITAFTQYYESTFDKVQQLSSTYVQLKLSFEQYGQVVDAMLAKLPATVPSCVKVP